MKKQNDKTGSKPRPHASCRAAREEARTETSYRRKKLEKALDAIEGAYLASVRFSIEDLSAQVLEAAKELTGSSYGFAAYIDIRTGWMIAPTLSRDAWKGKLAADKPLVFKDFTGLWGWVLKNKKPLLTNTVSSDPRSSGTPPGHIKVLKFLAVPAIFNNKLAGIIALANPAKNYEKDDLKTITKLARVYAIIIQRKLAEDQLKESEEKYRAIINASRDVICTYNLEGRITYISRQVTAYGYSPAEVIGRHLIEFIHPDDRYCISQALSKAIRTGVTQPLIGYRVKKKDGSYTQAEQKTGFITRNGKPFLFCGVMRDVSERERLRRRLVENEETLRRIFDTATDVIFVKDLKGRYLRINKAGADMLNLRPADAIGKTDHAIFPERSAAESAADDESVIKNGKTVFATRARTIAGRDLHLNVVKTPLRDANGDTIGILGIVRDITELKEMEAELVRAKAMEAVNKVAGPAAHDFNNILAAINGYATLIMESMKAEDPAKPEIAQILKAVERAEAITERLQTYGSDKAGA